MQQIILELNLLDIFFIIIAIISLFFNVIQFMDRRKAIIPLRSSLIALFNNIKSKSSHAFITLSSLNPEKSPHKDIDTLRWEYNLFIHTVINHLRGFQETVVGLLVAIDPNDKEGKQAFWASAYGLTQEEKNQREEMVKRLRDIHFSKHSTEPPVQLKR